MRVKTYLKSSEKTKTKYQNTKFMRRRFFGEGIKCTGKETFFICYALTLYRQVQLTSRIHHETNVHWNQGTTEVPT